MLILSREYRTSLKFDELKRGLKKRVGLRFKLGVLDNDEINLYYMNDSYTEAGLDRVPYCQIKARSHNQPDEQLRIKLGIADFVLVVVAGLPIMLTILLASLNVPFPFYSGAFIYPAMYVALQVVLTNQGERFQMELRKIEKEFLK